MYQILKVKQVNCRQ